MSTESWWSVLALAMWMVLVKVTKLVPHFYRHPGDLCFIPLTLVFGYFHGLIKYYSLLTIKNVGILLINISQTN
jgi:hypothetical protein